MSNAMVQASAASRQAAQPLTGDLRDYDRLLESIGDARFVLIGEASHGTHEFYAERAAPPTPTMRSAASSASQPGCGATRWCGSLSSSCTPTTRAITSTPPYPRSFLIHIDSTAAVRPLERRQPWDSQEPPETYPSAL